jgi:glucose uptake protein GlcU
VQTDKNGTTKISVLNVIIPIVAGVIGLVLLVLGLVMSRFRPEDEEYEDDDEDIRVPV